MRSLHHGPRAAFRLTFLLLWTSVVGAQGLDRVQLQLQGVPAKAYRGAGFEARILARIDDGWHIYGLTKVPGPIPTQITIPRGQPFALSGDIGAPLPRIDRDSVFGADVEFYEGETEFRLPVKVDRAAAIGRRMISIGFRYQVCSGSTCLPPKNIVLTGYTEVAASSHKLQRKRSHRKKAVHADSPGHSHFGWTTGPDRA